MGYSASPTVPLDVRHLIQPGAKTLYGFFLLEELSRYSASEYLSWLAQMVAAQQLHPSIEVEAPWEDIGTIAQQLLQRRFTGKAALHLNK